MVETGDFLWKYKLLNVFRMQKIRIDLKIYKKWMRWVEIYILRKGIFVYLNFIFLRNRKIYVIEIIFEYG